MSKQLMTLENLQYFKTKFDTLLDGKFINKNQLGVGIATLVSGKIPVAQLPSIALTDTFVVASQAEMLALNAQAGDVAIRTDIKKTFILKTGVATSIDNWAEFMSPDCAVSSVNGMTGAVVIPVATTAADGLMSKADKSKLNGLNNYTLPTASASVLGGVKIGANITISNGVISTHAPYSHPSTHDATMITESAAKRFVSDTEKNTWNGKANNTLASASSNGLMSKDDKVKLDDIGGYVNNTDIDAIFA